MAGDVENPRIWEGADAYTAVLGTTAPVDVAAAWGAGWEAFGLLSEDGATESRDEDTADHFAWGGILVRTSRKNHKRSITITALEDNLTIFGLVNPGSTAATSAGPTPPAGTTTRTVKIPKQDVRAFGLETRDGTIIRRRVIPRGEVVEVGEVTLSDSEMTAYELTISVYPDADGVLYLDLSNDPQAAVAP